MAQTEDINMKINLALRHEIEVEVRALEESAVIPSQGKPSDAGYDLTATVDAVIYPGQRETIRTGISVAIPEGYVGYIKPRSGLAVKHGIDVLAGVIDSGYRGEIMVVLLNTDSNRAFSVVEGDRIAQLVIQPVASVTFTEVPELSETERGVGGFGSTGVRFQ